MLKMRHRTLRRLFLLDLHQAQVLRLRLLLEALLSTQTRPNVEIIKPNMYVYIVDIHTRACC